MKTFKIFIVVLTIVVSISHSIICAQGKTLQSAKGKYVELIKNDGKLTAVLWESGARQEKRLFCRIVSETEIEVKKYIPFVTIYFSGKNFQDKDYGDYFLEKEFTAKVEKKSGTDICLKIVVVF